MKFQINEKTKLKTTKFELDLEKGISWLAQMPHHVEVVGSNPVTTFCF